MNSDRAVFPEVEMWSENDLTDEALVAMIEASNAYALSEFKDPVNDIYAAMVLAVLPYLPQLIKIAVDQRQAENADDVRPYVEIAGPFGPRTEGPLVLREVFRK